MSVRITGTVARDAHYTVAPADERVHLHLVVHTGGAPDDARMASALVVQVVGQGHAAMAAAAHAVRHLRRGRAVTIYGDALELVGGHLVVAGVNCVQPDGVLPHWRSSSGDGAEPAAGPHAGHHQRAAAS